MIRFLALLAVAIGLSGQAAAAPTSFDQRIAAIRDKVPVDPARALADAERLRALPRDESVRAHEEANIDWLRAEALLNQQKPNAALRVVHTALENLRSTQGEFTIRGNLFLTRAGAAIALGRVQDALQDEQTAYRLYEKAGNPRQQAKALLYIGNLYSDAGDSATALRYFDQSIEAYSADRTLRLSAQNNRANALSQLRRFRSGLRLSEGAYLCSGRCSHRVADPAQSGPRAGRGRPVRACTDQSGARVRFVEPGWRR